jgi:hypothetical protein
MAKLRMQMSARKRCIVVVAANGFSSGSSRNFVSMLAKRAAFAVYEEVAQGLLRFIARFNSSLAR